ncbi:hypothetical protein GUY44_02830 [Pimelobacter simplex]|uniref:Uncharacterized protein n=1 Tax=Nocardioides simplex TaxID=2045 RepID=A0A0A1DPE9_NOCSI|nr:hypothetical protein [Pimelobacter simplex]AIY19296.1 hypothetical protein KR76_25540 [Pimelobacter simplex]MCG8149400.1 hypothetical protein [Pimelobacter simplex]GEB16476.1 hypothetical protein NSI01_47910 [Pimelobacter simplex]SFM19579.1 hypothetical protein SAMN05421671_0223 [Pimelobacter simplex]
MSRKPPAPPSERSAWHVVAPFARYDRSTEYTMLVPTSTIHAKEMGTLTTACGQRSDSWFKFWAEDFPMPGAEPCRDCWHVVRSTPRR